MATVITAVVSVIGAIVGSGLIQYFINRADDKKDKLSAIEKKLDKTERDACRTQLLLLMAYYKEDKSEILTLAKHYFDDLQGDWYMSSMFNKWLKLNNIDVPNWFNMKGE